MPSAERFAVILVASAAVGCASVNAPPGFLPGPIEASQWVHGAWIDLRMNGDTGIRTLSGELLAITRDSLWILVPGLGGHVVPRRGVAGEMGFYKPEMGSIQTNTLLGTVSTISNGFFLIITAPAWWLTGTLGGKADAANAVKQLADDPPDAKMSPLAAYARYPQGIPARMDAAYTRVRP